MTSSFEDVWNCISHVSICFCSALCTAGALWLQYDGYILFRAFSGGRKIDGQDGIAKYRYWKRRMSNRTWNITTDKKKTLETKVKLIKLRIVHRKRNLSPWFRYGSTSKRSKDNSRKEKKNRRKAQVQIILFTDLEARWSSFFSFDVFILGYTVESYMIYLPSHSFVRSLIRM